MKDLIHHLADSGIKPVIAFILFAIMRILIDPKSRKLSSTATIFIIGVPLGVLVNLIALEWGIGENTAMGIGCVCVLLGERIIWAIMNIDVDDIITQAIKKVIGKK